MKYNLMCVWNGTLDLTLFAQKFDGASKGNPGLAGAGAIIMKGEALEEV